MALFKSLRGKRENLPSSKTDGYAYFCTDDGTFWIDYTDDSGVVQRKQINAKDAETIMGHTVEVDVPADAKFTDTTYSDATTSTSGLMSDSDKIKLDGIEAEANKTIVDSALSSTSTNPVQNKAINTKFNSVQASIDSKVDIVDGKGLSTNDYTTAEKNKLAGIESGANNYSLPVATSDTLGGIKSGTDITIDSSGNVSVNDDSHNHIIANVDGLQTELDSKVDKVDGKGLSTNDLTATLKSNYDTAYTHSQQPHAPADAEANVIVGIQKNGTDLTITNKKVNITVPTKITDLTNDSDFATTTQLDTKVDKVTGKGLSTNDYTTEDKEKLAAIEDGANKTVVDAALSATSTNPVQNKAVNTKFTSIQADIDSRVPNSRTVNGKSLTDDIILSASDVGALPDTTVIPSIDGLATETYVNNKVAGLVGSAPETLDTLNELAAALGGDANFATTVANQIGTKVDKVDGKGLSANDYTDAEKAKLEGIATGAQVNQNAFSNVIVGSITIAADDVTDSLTLAAGDNVTINADAANDKITISAIDTTYNEAGTELGLVKSGGDVTISNGVITVNDDSHNHIISNVDGLQAELDSKVNVETGKGLSTNDLTDVLKENYDTAYIHSQQPHNYAGSSTSGGAATSANKLNTDAGSETQPVYFKNGVPIVTNTLDSVAFDGYVTKGAESGSTIGASATVEGGNNMASSKQSHAEGGYTRAGDLTLYSESTGMFDSYGYEHAEGYSTLAKKCAAHAEGAHTQAIASMAHAEGLSTIASGGKSHAEGHSTTASGPNAHAEGYSTTASGENTHAEGNSTTASSQAAHAEGHSTEASGYASHSEGTATIASGSYSHAEGFYTKAASQYQHAQGKYNIEDTADTYAHIVGNGTSDTARSNAHTLDWNGNAWFAGDVYVGSTSGTNKDDGSKKLQTEITGTQGQIVGFDENGSAIAQDKTPSLIPVVDVYSEDGVTYTGTLDGLTSYDGALLVFRPNMDATAYDFTVNINGLGSKKVVRTTFDTYGVFGKSFTERIFKSNSPTYCMYKDGYFHSIDQSPSFVYDNAPTENSHKFVSSENIKYYVDTVANTKQDKLSGTAGQIVGFDASGNAVAQDIPTKPAGNSYLTFSSKSPFSISATKVWDGTLEYYKNKAWTTWDGSTVNAEQFYGDYVLYFRGARNTAITYSSGPWTLTGTDIRCDGNIETLLDYASVDAGEHPSMREMCYRDMFKECTSLISAPALPATTLSNYCYFRMFYNCSKLKSIPSLPAITVSSYAYQQMFYGCSSIKLSSTQTGEYTQPYRIPKSGVGNAPISALSNMFALTGGTMVGTPNSNTTYYLSFENSIVYCNQCMYESDSNAKYLPKTVSITLSASSWDSSALTQTVTVTGILADETAQLITPTPALASQAAYYESGILCTGQAANSLTFTADTIPTADLTVYVVIQEVSA